MKNTQKGIQKRMRWLAPLAAMLLALTACSGGGGNNSAADAGTDQAAGNGSEAKQMRDVSVVLDWTPNTNHTGLYAAVDQGFYEKEGLNVKILQPGAGGADQMVASGEVPFGVSYQESVTQARVQGVPLVSIAAVIQHNTSGFAAPADRNIKSPKDFEGKRYGGWGSPVEEAVMKSIMDQEGADVSKVEKINMGEADFFTAVKRDIDFAWIYYAWTGIEAQLRNEPIDMLYVKDYSDSLDYYTPVLVTNEKQIADDPELVKSFMKATAEGYRYAIDHPAEAADILIKAVPDLDPKLVKASQEWLSPKYQDDAAQWGWQKPEVWKNYGDWMGSQKLLEGDFDYTKAFTNDYLPAADAK
ncbi:ABC transporter substrate-binding protein [Saccharibacillus alkalitolerans]|uniref:ABC transporter substrate-binding protein n=1 Tax=Saccharibacillus alkalitolerans TaxID=2705290 RepID=A0ABX0FDQ3_9BACL|nr:ABC transporter substrate-binding protein [Saccharibacillus alkalitolerans]NGZ77924.1 ABC transporter substrate-binding protein [Saccharibacillus alkalitolerans]